PMASEAVVADLVRRSVPPQWPGALVVLLIQFQRHAELLAITQARGLARLLAGLSKNREEDRCQDGDDRDHHEQFDQSEADLLESLLEWHGLLRLASLRLTRLNLPICISCRKAGNPAQRAATVFPSFG